MTFQYMTRFALSVILVSIGLISCSKEESIPINDYKTENIVIVVMDGARYSETWNSPQNIPKLAEEMSKHGIVCDHFYNNGRTFTVPGHTAITTGNYQEINNNGSEIPKSPSLFQYWLKSNNKDSTSAWIISSKDKLEVLSNCDAPEWRNQYNPSTNCGVSGLGSGYRTDSITFSKSIDILTSYHPQIVLINFREPDYSGHKNDWDNYLKGIKDVDEYIYQLWNFLETDALYRDKTTLFVTNDHGRHLDNVADGFVSHGDNCLGCRHIGLFAFGPDFKKGFTSETSRGLIDISSTAAELMHLDIPSGRGDIMIELFK